MTTDEVLEVARAGQAAGCAEALFTLGDKPELRYRVARDELAQLGHSTTIEYLVRAAREVVEQTGLLPHLNPGVATREELVEMRKVSASMGLMLESTSAGLMERGGAHFGSPDKEPSARLAMLETAGELKIPFTTGLLIGLGETWADRIETLFAIAESHARWGHVQEVIVQNFKAKPDTLMHAHAEPSVAEMVMTIALARLILPADVSVQAPPNLAGADEVMLQYLGAGIDDWGGVSPVTPDHVNPEAPWPHIAHLRAITESAGHLLLPRLTVYPRYIPDGEWIAREIRGGVLAKADTSGLLRDDRWHPGESIDPPDVIAHPWGWTGSDDVLCRPEFIHALDRARQGEELQRSDVLALFEARGPEVPLLFGAADSLRERVNGDTVTYVINRNINYTNMCYFKCGFCAFSKGPASLNLRGEPYLLDLEEIAHRALEAAVGGATEVCLQGGIHPSFTGDFYVQVLDAIKAVVPDMHIHAFSPLEVWQGAQTKGVSIRDFLAELKDHGLSTLPGTAAEILDDRIRSIICPDKISTQQWSLVARTAHALSLRMTTTIMFGHADDYASWISHMSVLRDIQRETGGFTEFVPLPFVHMGAPIFLRGKARRGPTMEETLKVHAVGRLYLHPYITNIQMSWVKLGERGAEMALSAGCNDLGGTLMNENISRAAGAVHGQEMTPQTMEALARRAGRRLARRNTLYDILEGPNLEFGEPIVR